ncbi:MAG: hypothetical protein NVS9B12_03580 [Vulcanimicrobiaceae bacterium]
MKWLAALRIYAGAFWLIHGLPKFSDPQFMGFMPPMTQKLAAGTSGPYHAFLTGFVVPHAELVSQLIRTGEVLVGVSLLLGLFTRAGAVGGMVLASNYILAKGAAQTIDTYAGLDFSAFAFSFFNLVLPTAAIWSADAALGRRRRRR